MADKFLGIPYPLTKSPLGYFRPQGGVEQIKSDMLILLLTNPGERVMLPEYGTGLRDLIFEPNDADLRARARQLIIKAIKDWEPRVRSADRGVDVHRRDQPEPHGRPERDRRHPDDPHTVQGPAGHFHGPRTET